MQRDKGFGVILTLFFLLLVGMTAAAQTTYTWNVLDGTWDTATNWSPNGIPGTTDNVIISNGILRMNGVDRTINNINISQVSGGDTRIEMTGNLTINGTMTWDNGYILGDTLTTGIDDTLTIAVGAALEMNTGSKKNADNIAIVNNGAFNWTAGNFDLTYLTSTRESYFLNNSIVNITMTTDRNLLGGEFTIFENLGTINFSNTAASPITQFSLFFNDQGTVNVNAGTLDVRVGGVFTKATHNLASGAVIWIRRAGFTVDSLVTSGSGVSLIEDATITLNNDLVTQSGATTYLQSSEITGAANVVVDGTFQFDRTRIGGTGEVLINPGGSFGLVSPQPKNIARLIRNKGTITWDDSSIVDLEAGGDIINDTTGTMLITGAGTFSLVGGTGLFTNYGTVVKNGGGKTNWNVPFVNNGEISLLSDSLRFTKSLTNNDSGAVSGVGFLDVSAGAGFTNRGAFHPGDTLGALNFVGNYVNTTSTTDLDIQIGGNTPGAYDQLLVNGSAQLGGVLSLSRVNGFHPVPTDTFHVVKYGSRTGTFSSVDFPGHTYNLAYTDSSVMLTEIQRDNFAPVAVVDSITTDEEVAASVNVLANDSDGDADPMTIASFTQPTGGVVAQLGDSSFTYTPNANFFGADSFTYTVADGFNGSTVGTVRVTVNSINDNPVITGLPDLVFDNDSTEVLNLGTYTNDVDHDKNTLVWAATVIDAQPLPTSKVSNPALLVDVSQLNVAITDSIATFTANADSGGIYTVVFSVTDPLTGSDTDTMVVTLNIGNFPPVVSAPIPDFNFDEDSGPVVVESDLNNVFSDGDIGTIFTFTAVSENPDIQVSVNGNELSVTSTADFVGSGNVIVTADDDADTVSDTFLVTIDPVNDAPVAANVPDVNFNEDASTTLNLKPYGSDIDNLVGELSWTATVIAAQAPPSKRGSSYQITPADLTVNVTGDTLANFSATADSGGVFTVVFTVSDPGALSSNDTVTVTVNQTADAPYVASAIADLVYNEDDVPATASANLNNNFADPDPGTTLNFSAVSDNADISATVSNDSLLISSTLNYSGSGTVVVTASDGGLSVTDTFAVTINAVNDAPVIATIPDVNFTEDGSTTVALNDYVADVDNLDSEISWAAEVLSASGTVTKNGVTREVTPADLTVTIDGSNVATFAATADSNGVFTVKFTATDPGLLSDTDTVSVTVSSVNDAPFRTATIADVAFNEDAGPVTASANLNSNFSDPDPGTTLVFSAVSDNANITATVSGSQLTVNAAADFFGTGNVVVTASDGSLAATDTFAVTVNAVNDAPVVAGIPDVGFSENGSQTVSLDDYVTDVDNLPADMSWAAEVLSASGTVTKGGVSREVTPADLTVTIDGSNVATFSATADSNGVFTVKFTATDPGTLADTDTITVTVTPVNNAPVISAIPDASFPEDGSETVALNDYVSDVDNSDSEITWVAEVLTASGTVTKNGFVRQVTPADLSVTIDGNNVATYSATADSNGVFTVKFTATDPGLLSDTDTVTVTISSVNDAPFVVTPISDVTFNEDEGPVTATTTLSSNFSDPDPGTTLIFSASSDNVNITATVNGNALDVNAAANFSGTGNVLVTASDGSLTVTDTVAVTVNAVNDAPVVANIPDVTFSEDGSTTVALNDYVTDVDNLDSEISWAAEVLSASGTVTKGGVTREVTPADLTVSIDGNNVATLSATADSNGVFTVKFTATDPGLLSDTDTITVTVNSVNDAPFVASAIADVSFNEDGGPVTAAANLNSNFADPDPGTTLLFSASSDNANISASLSGSQLSVNAAANFFGAGNVIVTASDGSLSVTDTFAVTVSAVNDAPVVANIPDVSFTEDGSTTVALNNYVNDVDNLDSEISWAAEVLSASGTVTKNGRTRAITPADLTVSIDGSNVATFSATADSNGVFTVKFTATDPGLLSDTDTMTVTISSVNDAPFVAVAIPDLAFNEDEGPAIASANLNNNFSDPDPGTTLLYSVSSDNANITAALSGSQLNVNASTDFSGSGNVIVIASDGSLTVSDTFAVTVNAVNDAPVVATIPDVSFSEDGSTTVALNNYVSDVDNLDSEISWAAEVLSASGTVTKGGVTREVTPADLTVSIDGGNVATLSATADSNGVFTVKFTATDPGLLSDTDTVTVTVSSVNDAPFVVTPISDVTFNEDEGPVTATTTLSSNFSDPDPGTTLNYTASSDNANITATVTGSQLTVNASANYFGTGNVVVTASDGALSVTDTFAVTVNAINDAPVIATIPDVSFPEDGSSTVALNDYVADVDNLDSEIGWVAEVLSASGTVTKNGRTRAITPADLTVGIDGNNVATFSASADSNGVFTVKLTATDPGDLSDTDTVTVTISSVNDAPFVTSAIGDVSFVEDLGPVVASADLNSNFADPDPGTTLIFTATADAGILPSISNGQLTVNTQLNYTGTGNVVVRASDGSASVTDTFSVTVSPVNDPPAIAPAMPDISFPEGESTTLALNDYGTDPDNLDSELSWTATVLSATSGTLTVDIDGSNVATFSASGADSGGVFTVKFDVSDPSALSDTDTITVTIANVNDAPVIAPAIPDISFPEDGSTTLGLNEYVNDIDNLDSELSWTAEVLSAAGTVTKNGVTREITPSDLTVSIDGNNVASFAASADSNGVFTVKFTVTDPGALSDTDTILVTANSVNDAPVIAPAIPDISFPENGSSTLSLNDYVTDIDHNDSELNWTAEVLTGNVNQLTIAIDANNSATFSSSADSGGVFTVKLTVTDPGDLSDTDTISVTIADVNDAPVIAPAMPDVSFPEDGSTTVALNDYVNDIDNLDSELSWTAEVLTASGTFTKDGRTREVTPADLSVAIDANNVATISATADSNGVFTVKFTVTDPGNLSDTDTIAVTIASINDAPVIAPAIPDVSFPEDGSTTVALNDYVSDADHSDAQLTWTAQVLTATGGSTAVQIDPSDLSVAIDGNNVATFSATADSGGVFTVKFTVSDPGNLTDTDTITVTVESVNDAPVVVNPIANVAFNEDAAPVTATANLSAVFSDADPGTTLEITATTSDANVTATISNDSLIVGAAANYFGNAQVFVSASDGIASVTDTVGVTVVGVNDAPEITPAMPDVAFGEDESTTLNLDDYVADVDNAASAMLWTAEVLTATGVTRGVSVDPTDLDVTIDPATRVATFSATSDTSGIFTVKFTVSDPGNLTDTDTITVTISGENDPPAVANAIADVTFDEDSGPVVAAGNLNTVFSDPDPGTVLTFFAASNDPDIQVSISNDSLYVTSSLNYFGAISVVVSADDGTFAVDDTFDVTINPVNDAPVLVNLPAAIEFAEDDSITFFLDTLVTDVDNTIQEIVFSLAPSDPVISDNVDLVLDPVARTITLVPNENFNYLGGQVYVTATDIGGLSDSDTLDFNILPVNDAPYFLVEFESDTVKQDSTIGGNIWEIVEDPETEDALLTYTFSGNPDSLLVTYDENTGDVTITPVSGFTGTVALEFTVSDGELSASQTLTVVVEPTVGIFDDPTALPTSFDITQNYPNPFNPSTSLKFQLPTATDVRLVIYNVLGQKVRTLANQQFQAGYHEVKWDGMNDYGVRAATGVYIYRFEAGKFVKVMKMTLMK
ncbi:MAG: tandem-95 repeat protein [Calditrichae bacterium]|nr:tandem-95 repeat protein [Calditrichia bacterium]